MERQPDVLSVAFCISAGRATGRLRWSIHATVEGMCDGPLEYSQRSVEHGKWYAGAAMFSFRMIAGYGI
jgi:hypothetical protein